MNGDDFSYKKLIRSLRSGTDEKNDLQSTYNNKQDRKEVSTVRLLKELQLSSIKSKK